MCMYIYTCVLSLIHSLALSKSFPAVPRPITYLSESIPDSFFPPLSESHDLSILLFLSLSPI